jgi:glycosyltransferase involved in cell wall biosynthesis
MKLCVVTIKDTWQDAQGRWVTDGGFPGQMASMCALFDEVTMLLVQVPPRAGGMPLPDGARIVPLPRPAGQDFRRKLSVLARMPYYAWRIAREVRRADVVHTPLPGDIGILGMLAAQLFGKRVVARYCGSWFSNSQTTLMNRVTRFWMRRTAGGRNVMLATGHGAAPPSERMHWIFATAVSRHELAAVRADLDRPLSSPARLVFIGRLSPEKGLDVFIDALASMKARGFEPMPHVTFLGDGAARAALERLARDAGLAIVFAGQVDRLELRRHLLVADVCVQPSLSEGFSKAWLDALAHGVPVLASDVGAANVVLGADGERGWLIPAGSAMALATRLERVLTDAIEWPSLRRRCRAFAETHTLEAWGGQIGAVCAEQWGLRMEEGRIVA